MSYSIVYKNDEYSKKVANLVKEKFDIPYDEINPDFVICVGGDGTTLSAIHKYESQIDHIIIFSIHTGHLGFFSSFEVSDIDEILKLCKSKEISIEHFSLLNYKFETMKGQTETGIALNELTIINPTRTLMLDVFINGMYFEHYRGTGLCISTSAGSTGYNKSLNGAIISPTLEAYELTEIAGINSNLYHTISSPLVLSSKDEIILTSSINKEVWITVDARSINIGNFKSLSVSMSDKKASIANHGVSHFERIKKNFI